MNKIKCLFFVLFVSFLSANAQEVTLKLNGFFFFHQRQIFSSTHGIGLEYRPVKSIDFNVFYNKSIWDDTRNDGNLDEIRTLSLNVRKYFKVDQETLGLFVNGQFGFGQVRRESYFGSRRNQSSGSLAGLGVGSRYQLGRRFSIEALMLYRYFFSSKPSNNKLEINRFDEFSVRFEVNLNITLFKIEDRKIKFKLKEQSQ